MNKVIIIGTIEFLSDMALIHKIERKVVVTTNEELKAEIKYAESNLLDYVIPVDYEYPCYMQKVDNDTNRCDHICKCNMCDSILIDQNPQIDAKEYELIGNELEMEWNNGDEENDPHWVCPKCGVDDYLIDL